MDQHLPLICIGLDHHSSDHHIRRLVSMEDDVALAVMERMREIEGIVDAFALSTCNRVELHALLDTAASSAAVASALQELLRTLAQQRSAAQQLRFLALVPDERLMDEIGLVGDERPKPLCVYAARADHELKVEAVMRAVRVREGEAALAHMTDTCMGLESASIGDTKILSQVQHAYRRARLGDMIRLNGTLDRIVRLTLTRAQRMRLQQPALSSAGHYKDIGSVAGIIAGMDIDYLRSETGMGASVLILGSNLLARAAAESVSASSCHLHICSTDLSAAHAVGMRAKRAHAGRENSIHYTLLSPEHLHDRGPFDIVICADSVEGAYLSAADLAAMQSKRQARFDARGLDCEINKVTLIDLTDGAGIDTSDAVFTTAEVRKHFATSMRASQRAISAAVSVSNEVQAACMELVRSMDIAGELRSVSAAVDAALEVELAAIRCDPALDEPARAERMSAARRAAAKRKHERVNQVRRAAGLSVRSRHLTAA
jgi:glutamyl-tRNA reductase